MFNVLTLNNIAKIGLSRLPASSYQIGNDVKDPDLVLLRSANMHSGDIPKSLKAVGPRRCRRQQHPDSEDDHPRHSRCSTRRARTRTP